jgi:hypothetical protein
LKVVFQFHPEGVDYVESKEPAAGITKSVGAGPLSEVGNGTSDSGDIGWGDQMCHVYDAIQAKGRSTYLTDVRNSNGLS